MGNTRGFFDGMADGMTEIQNPALAFFRFIPVDHAGLDDDRIMDEFLDHVAVQRQCLRPLPFQIDKHFRIGNNGVLDNLGEPA